MPQFYDLLINILQYPFPSFPTTCLPLPKQSAKKLANQIKTIPVILFTII